MTADGESCQAATAYRPQAEKSHEKAVAILDRALLEVFNWQCQRDFHKLDTEVESLPRGNETIEPVLGTGQGGQACFDRS